MNHKNPVSGKLWRYRHFGPHLTKKEKKEKKVEESIILILISSIQKVRKSTLSTALSSYSPISDFLYFEIESQESIYDIPKKSYYIAVIGAVKSVDDYSDRLKEICNKVGFS